MPLPIEFGLSGYWSLLLDYEFRSLIIKLLELCFILVIIYNGHAKPFRARFGIHGRSLLVFLPSASPPVHPLSSFQHILYLPYLSLLPLL